MLEIPFESEDFAESSAVRNGFGRLAVSWDDLLWAAITVGRPNWHFVLQHGASSLYEALFRASALRVALEQASPGSSRLRRTAAAMNLDPSEKGAINYFLGLTLCKLFAAKKLGAPWLLHLDVFRNQLSPTLFAGRSRPDLVGLTTGGHWVALESKGRVSPPTADTKKKAKEQAERLIAVNGLQVTYRIGAFAYFKNQNLRFFWRDPQPDGKEPRNAIRLGFSEEVFWKAYYLPILRLARTKGAENRRTDSLSFEVKECDFHLKVATPVLDLLNVERWKDAGDWCREHPDEIRRLELSDDGVAVVAGASWSERFSDSFE